jgi:hypothetical protein
MPKPTPHEVKTYALEKAFIPKLIRIIKNYRKGFISDLRNSGQSTALSNLQQQIAPADLTRLLDILYKRVGVKGIRDELQRHKPYILEAARQIRRSGKKSFEYKAGGFGRNEDWIRDIMEYLGLHMVRMVQEITETMRQDITRVVQKGIDQGWSIDQIVKQLLADGVEVLPKARFTKVETRARLIARTEVNGATNAGHRIAASKLPYEVRQKWSAANDHRTRHGHRAMNGKQIDEDETFKVPVYKGDKLVGYEQMIGPGDPNASVGNLANCRCRGTFIPKRYANGSLIMRNPNQARIIPMREPLHSYTHEQIAAQLKANTVITVK